MKKLISILFFSILIFRLFATIINIPVDQPTIQEGINTASTGDTILVQPGIYQGGLSFYNKTIVVASLFLTTQDTSYISQTILRNHISTLISFYTPLNFQPSEPLLCGFLLEGTTQGGTIYSIFTNPTLDHLFIKNNFFMTGGVIFSRNSNITLKFFKIFNNNSEYGGAIYSYNSNFILTNGILKNNFSTYTGGAIYLENSSCFIENTLIINNTSNKAGAIYCNSSEITLKNSTIKNNYAEICGGIYCENNSNLLFDEVDRSSIFNNNSNTRGYGADLYIDGSESINVVLDTFSVFNPTDFYATPISNYTFDILHAVNQNTINSDIYVSPNGDNNNSGLTIQEPFKTIQYALSRIYTDSLNYHTIHLLPGIYSPQTNGEIFPIFPSSFLVLQGESPDNTILDSNESNRIFNVLRVKDFILRNITIKNGNSSYAGAAYIYKSDISFDNVNFFYNSSTQHSGAIYFDSSNSTLENIIFENNNSYDGGAITSYFSDIILNSVILKNNWANNNGGALLLTYQSNCNLINTIIKENFAHESGSGLYLSNSSLFLSNSTISQNIADHSGGGIYCINNSSILFDSENRNNIYNNGINYRGFGSDIYSLNSNTIQVILDTFSVFSPTDFYTFPLENYTFDILHCTQDSLLDFDLYVSPLGNNSNDGLSPNAPLKTIKYALSRIYTDSLNPHTIYIAPGIYSQHTNGERFPISINSYVSLVGESPTTTILDADSTARVITFEYSINPKIKNLSIVNGCDDFSGGIYSFYSNPLIENVEIINNSSLGVSGFAGGIYAESSQLNLINIHLSRNFSDGEHYDATALYLLDSSITAKNVLIDNNYKYRMTPGNVIYCLNSDLILTNISITDNYSVSNDSLLYTAIRCFSSNINLTNSILFNDNYVEIDVEDFYGSSMITISHSDIQGGEEAIEINGNPTINWLQGNIDADPLFADSLYHVSANSPCIDAGTPDTTGLDLPIYDLDNNFRIWDGDNNGIAIIDMGAYEFGSSPVSSDNDELEQISLCKLYQNYPNPFNPSTNIDFFLKKPANVKLTIYNLKGQKVKTLISKDMKKGFHSVNWNGTNDNNKKVSSGVYLYKIDINGITEQIKKCVLMK